MNYLYIFADEPLGTFFSPATLQKIASRAHYQKHNRTYSLQVIFLYLRSPCRKDLEIFILFFSFHCTSTFHVILHYRRAINVITGAITVTPILANNIRLLAASSKTGQVLTHNNLGEICCKLCSNLRSPVDTRSHS